MSEAVVERIAEALLGGGEPVVSLVLRRELLHLPREERRRAGLELAMLSASLAEEHRERHRAAIIEIAKLLEGVRGSLTSTSASGMDSFSKVDRRAKKLLGS